MEGKEKVILTFIVLVFLVAFLYLFSDWFSKATGYIVEDNPDNSLAKCLTERGAVLYGSNLCPNCKIQRNLFGISAFKFLNYVECSDEPLECSNLRGVPAWRINGTIYYGIKTLEQLRALSGCIDA